MCLRNNVMAARNTKQTKALLGICDVTASKLFFISVVQTRSNATSEGMLYVASIDPKVGGECHY